MEKTISPAGVVDFFEGGAAAEAVREQEQWLNAIINDTDPLVLPQQAYVVTQSAPPKALPWKAWAAPDPWLP